MSERLERTPEEVESDYDNLLYRLHAAASIAKRLGLEEIANEAADLCERARVKRDEEEE